MKKLIGTAVIAMLMLMTSAIPAFGHGTGSVNAQQPGQAFGNVYGRAQYVLNGHPSYRVTAWLQRRIPGSSWVSVTSSTRISSDGYASTAFVARNCRYDYRSIGEGWARSSTGSLHAYAQDLTSSIISHTC
jgi:hypothetical protein